MSRVEATERSDEQRQNQPRQPRNESSNVGHTPTKAEGDEQTVDEALKNQEKRQ